MEEKDNTQKERTIEDYKKWFNEECDENMKLKEELRRLKEVVKAQAAYIASI